MATEIRSKRIEKKKTLHFDKIEVTLLLVVSGCSGGWRIPEVMGKSDSKPDLGDA